MDLTGLIKLQKRLKDKVDDRPIYDAIEQLIKLPDDIDNRINLLGLSHKMHWLPNRKRALWNALDNGSDGWIQRCIERIHKAEEGDLALFSLLNSNAIRVLQFIKVYSSDIVQVWDMKGAESCGIGLAAIGPTSFLHYFYIGWKVNDPAYKICRIDYAQEITNHLGKSYLYGNSSLTNWAWAELPSRCSIYTSTSHVFGERSIPVSSNELLYTKPVVETLRKS